MFLTRALLEDDPKPDMWVVMQDLIWEDVEFGRLVVPVGFRTDLASIPRVFRNLPSLDPNGISRRPAVMHDWLYAWRGIGKDRADDFLKRSLIIEGASMLEADMFWAAVHYFGQSSWDGDVGVLATTSFDTPEHYATWKARG